MYYLSNKIVFDFLYFMLNNTAYRKQQNFI